MARKFDRMPDLPATVDDAKVEEFMEHYYAMSNDGSDHEGFAELFIEDGEYSMNDKITKGRRGKHHPPSNFHLLDSKGSES